MESEVQRLLARLPGKDCGQCGFKTCEEFAHHAAAHPEALRRCLYVDQPQKPGAPPVTELLEADITWKDILGRDYEFILEPFADDPGPRETILPFNTANAERLAIKQGDILFGRPAWVGCPVTHVGKVMEDPDPLNGTIVWCVVGPLAAREHGIEIGQYNPVAYEGIVRFTRQPLHIGARYHFLPHYCMLQSRHSAVISALAKRKTGLRVRLEGIWID